MPSPTLRPGQDDDAQAIIDLIAACWSLYPGVRMDVDGEMPELRALATYYAGQGGALWVTDDVSGMIATRPLADGAWEICRVYVHPSQHGSGLGHRLLDQAEAHAIAQGATRLVLWSDTRFTRAHRFYERRSYLRAGPIRVLDDISNSLEYEYDKPINGVRVLDAAAAASAEARFADILIACVAEGAGVSFWHPLSQETARAFWHQAARDVATGGKRLIGGWVDGVLAGTVTLALAPQQNQPHRADIAKVLVDPAFRRTGLARRMMLAAEQEALRLGRTLLTLDTRSGSAAEALYRDMGWTEVGRIPGFALLANGTAEDDTAFFWKRLTPC